MGQLMARCLFAWVLALLISAPAVAQQPAAPEARCGALLEQAAGHLASEQYPTMLKVAEERQRLCPGPVSSFLVGLAQGNMVDNLLVQDPAERERMRQDALRNLQVAAAGGQALRPVWRFTAHDWIVHLQRMGPGQAAGSGGGVPGGADEFAQDAGGDALLEGGEGAPMQLPPPPPEGVFPVGPLVVGGVGVSSLVAALVTGISAGDRRATVRNNERQIREAIDDGIDEARLDAAQEKTQRARDEAETLQDWSTGLLVIGGVGVAAALTWYFALPPSDGWEWSVAPGGLQVKGRF